MPDINKVAAQVAKGAKATRRRARVDLSSHFGEPEGTTVWEYVETDVPTYYRAISDAAGAKDTHPGLTDELRAQIAGFALTHQSPTLPQGLAPFTFYANIAKGDARLWALLNTRYAQAFPELSAMSDEGIEEAKKNSTGRPAASSSPSASKSSTDTPPSATE